MFTLRPIDMIQLAAAKAKKELNYTLIELKRGRTHDALWAVRYGCLASCFWARKTLEWTKTPTIEMRTAHYLNNTYVC